MNGASKILTVSYGTFSCTLEGFDDPFNTMKAIAEYFRDLAAEDRYFGAEPPTPDAAMLHRIAEREIQRRVEAKISDNGVVLRADDAVAPRVSFPATRAADAVPVAAPAPVVSTAAEAAPAIESAAARLSRLRAAQAHLVQAPIAQAPVSQAPAPIAPPVALREPPLDAPSPAYIDAYGEDQDAEAEVAPPASAIVQASPVPPIAAASIAAAGSATAQVSEEKAAARELRKAKKVKHSTTEEQAAQSAQAEPVEIAAPVPLTETAKDVSVSDSVDLIANISEALAAPTPAVETQVVAAAVAAQPDPALDNLTSSIRETLAGLTSEDDQLAVDMAETQSAAPVVEAEADNGPMPPLPHLGPKAEADFLPETAELSAQPSQVDAYPATFPEAHDLATEAATDDTALDDAVLDDAALEDTLPDQEPAHPVAFTELAVDPAEVLGQTEAASAEAAEEPEAILAKGEPEVQIFAPVVAEKIQRARSRVIKIRRIDTAPQAEPESAPVADASAADVSPTALIPADLTPEAEADLQHELAALEAELGTPAQPVQVVRPQRVAPQGPAVSEQPRFPVPQTDEADVSRLLEKAKTEAEVPESKRRRSAIAHLKAAVLATVAERRINPNGRKPDQRMDPYRKDLDQAVRPVPSDRPAPLVLVSSQRIDRKPDSPRALNQSAPIAAVSPSTAPVATPPAIVQPVRPRRVSTGVSQALSHDMDDDDFSSEAMNNVFADASKQSFQEFADALGATSMGDLIEAAGAYYTLVLGHDSFTRPQLFQQISTLPSHADLSREDSLRGFGRLLRDGRMSKTKGGQYILAETSPLLTEAKRRVN